MSSLRKPGERRGSRGFVLIEVLVAASVAAVLLAQVMRIFASTWSGINSVREDATAMLVARNVIDANAPRNNLAAGTQEGATGRYAWKVTIEQMDLAPVSGIAPVLATTPANATSGSNIAANGGNNSGNTNNGGANGAAADNGVPWNLFRIDVVVRAPGGRRTVIETYRLSRPSQ